jgi:RNA recognition motif-containing protein
MNIYVGNLSRQADETQLKALFTQFGEVKSIRIVKDHGTGESRGFAFVEMKDDDSGNLAIGSLDLKEFLGKSLKVNEAKAKTPRTYNSFSSNFGYKSRNEIY